MPPTIPAKRPADSLSESRSQRQRVEASSQARTEPAVASANSPTIPYHPPMIYPGSTVPEATAQDLTIQTPAHQAQFTTNDKPVWLGDLVWSNGESEVKVAVQAINPIRYPWTSEWPMTLRVEIVEAGMCSLDLQARIRKFKAPVARLQCPPGTDSQHFGKLVKTLRKGKCVAIMHLEIEIQDKDTSKIALVFAPLHDYLLCATFPVSDLSKAGFEFSPQGEDPETDASVTVETPAQSMSPQQFQSQQPQVYEQGEREQSQGQEDAHHASLALQHLLADALASYGSEPMVAAENGAGAVFGPVLPHIDHWGMSTDYMA